MRFIIPCLVSFLFTVVITPMVIRIANKCNCLDVPGGRRLHCKSTPRWGGVAFFAGVLPLLFMENYGGVLTSYIAASLILVCMGAWDDLKSLDFKFKFAGMAIAASIVIFGGEITVHHIGTYAYFGVVELGWFSIPFTFLSIIGITNAINLLDGLNGLAGGVSLLGFLFMGFAALITGNIMVAVLCFAFVGALAAFLLFNFPNAKVFMGDSGSLFLGFSLAITALLLTQDKNSSVDSMFPVLVLLIPIFDTLRVLLVRLLNGKNPFKADLLHLHFLLVQNKFSPVHTVILFWTVTIVLGNIALALLTKTSETSLAVVLQASVLLALLASNLMQRQVENNNLVTIHRLVGAGLGLFTGRVGFISNFVSSGKQMTISSIVILGSVFVATQVSIGEPPHLKDGQATQDVQPATKSSGALSKHNQAMIKEKEAQMVKNENNKVRLSKRNQSALKQTEAAKARHDLIDKSNQDGAKQ